MHNVLRMAEHSEQLKAVGLRIQEIRAKKGYSQESFANDAGLARSYYGGVERGERNVSVINLIRIAKALDVEVGELFPKGIHRN